MSPTALDLSPEALRAYRPARRAGEAAHAQRARRECAWRTARQAAERLRREFGASRVVAFATIVTSNVRHFQKARRSLGLQVMTPLEFVIRRMKP